MSNWISCEPFIISVTSSTVPSVMRPIWLMRMRRSRSRCYGVWRRLRTHTPAAISRTAAATPRRRYVLVTIHHGIGQSADALDGDGNFVPGHNGTDAGGGTGAKNVGREAGHPTCQGNACS